jgi:transcription-repair coupling factor (superfamily II helicase)
MSVTVVAVPVRLISYPLKRVTGYIAPPVSMPALDSERRPQRGATLSRHSVEGLHEWALKVGFEVVPVVQEPGTIARRGGIVDVFPPGAEFPVRLDFFGDDIESIRRFDPHTQRSTDRLNRVILLH